LPTNRVENFFDQAFDPPFKEPYFSGEEGYGRYLDLHAIYQQFLNLKKLKLSEEYKIGDYLWYL
jgi:splicing factor 3A subunit 3